MLWVVVVLLLLLRSERLSEGQLVASDTGVGRLPLPPIWLALMMLNPL